MLTDSKTDMYKLSEEVHTFAFEVVFAQLKGYLTNLSNMEVKSESKTVAVVKLCPNHEEYGVEQI